MTLFHQHAQQLLSLFKSLSPTYTTHERLAISLAQIAAYRPSLAAVTRLHSIYSIAAPMCFTAEKIRLRDLALKSQFADGPTYMRLTEEANRNTHNPNLSEIQTEILSRDHGDDPTNSDFDDENGPEDPNDDGGEEPDGVDADLSKVPMFEPDGDSDDDPELIEDNEARAYAIAESAVPPFRCDHCSDPSPHIHITSKPDGTLVEVLPHQTNEFTSAPGGMGTPTDAVVGQAPPSPYNLASYVPPTANTLLDSLPTPPDELDIHTSDAADDACEQCGTYSPGAPLCPACRNELV